MLLLFTTSCEPDEIFEINQVEKQKSAVQIKTVKLADIPQIRDFLNTKTDNIFYKRDTDKNEAFFDIDNILEVIDTLNQTNYSFSFSFTDTPPGTFYNLIVGKTPTGEAQEPYVLKYTCNQDQLETYLANNKSFAYFKGKLSIHKYTDYFKSGYFNKGNVNCPPQFDEVGDPLACDTQILDGSSNGGGAGSEDGTGYTGSTGTGDAGSFGGSSCSWVVEETICSVGDKVPHNSSLTDSGSMCGGTYYTLILDCNYYKSTTVKKGSDCPDCPSPTGAVGVNDIQTKTIFKTESLTGEQKLLFNRAKNDLLESCLGAALLGAVKEVNITMGATFAVGEYNPVNNTISFRNNSDISATVLGAELMHAYQQQLYGTLDDIYNGTTNVGGSNMEFEEKAFNIKKDMLDIDSGMFTYPGEEALTSWLIDLDINHPTSSIVLNQSELDAWFDALEEFQQFHEGNSDHYGDPIDYNQNPDAILNLINKVLESDCN